MSRITKGVYLALSPSVTFQTDKGPEDMKDTKIHLTTLTFIFPEAFIKSHRRCRTCLLQHFHLIVRLNLPSWWAAHVGCTGNIDSLGQTGPDCYLLNPQHFKTVFAIKRTKGNRAPRSSRNGEHYRLDWQALSVSLFQEEAPASALVGATLKWGVEALS